MSNTIVSSIPSITVISALVYRDVDGTLTLDREASKQAFLLMVDLAETKRITGSTRIREAVAQVFKDTEKGSAPIDDVIMGAAYLLNAGPGSSLAALKSWQKDVAEFIEENSASDKNGDSLDDKLYLKGAGRTGLQIINEALRVKRTLAANALAEKAFRQSVSDEDL